MSEKEIAEEIYETQMTIMENRIEEHGRLKGIYLYVKDYYAQLLGLNNG